MESPIQLVFATNNAHKIEEAQAIVEGRLTLISLKEAGFDIEVDETGNTFFENAYLKAKAVFDATGLPCVADDSGLCVDALGGLPGVHSARYAGLPVNHTANNDKLLHALHGVEDRGASFRTVLCVVGLLHNETWPLYFEGRVDGSIGNSLGGTLGFGYDPLFTPTGCHRTFAEMGSEEKNGMSHRGNAFKQLMRYLDQRTKVERGAHVPPLAVVNYDYELPNERIAFEAIEPRDASKLLVVKGRSGERTMEEFQFRDLDRLLMAGDVLVANDTKVIPARLHGSTTGGAQVEVFLLNPMDVGWTVWEVMVGNRRKFKEEEEVVVGDGGRCIRVRWVDRERNKVSLDCEGGFANLQDAIEALGAVPLPPYIERAVHAGDKERYQAIFADKAGAVAAPTASLHFTTALKQRLENRGVGFTYLTLHVGAGTFKPMTAAYANEHEMHAERFALDLQFINRLINALDQGSRVVAIGTTSMRVLESIYYMGCRLIQGSWDGMVWSDDGYDLGLRKWEGRDISMMEAMLAVKVFVEDQGGVMQGQTQIFIVEGFEFRVVQGLITNFHQPKSTLLMLISAFLRGGWREVYGFALERDIRFLSYGDGSLLWR